MSLKKQVAVGEQVLFRLKKSKLPIVFMAVFVPVWLYFGYLLIAAYGLRRFGGDINMSPGTSALLGIAGFAFIIPMILMIVLSYFLNDLVITDKRVYTRRGLSAQMSVFNLADVASFQHTYTSGRHGKNNNRIFFYLLSGKIVKTGDLFIGFNYMEPLLELLRGRFEGRGYTTLELRKLASQNSGAGKPETTFYPAVLIVFLVPLALAALVAADYLL